MDADPRVLAHCLNTLRWLGLSFTTVHETPSGHFVASHSKVHLFLNAIMAAGFAFLFFHLELPTHPPAETKLGGSMVVYFLYTKIMALTIVLFSVCGNVYNRKCAEMVNRIRGVMRGLGREVGRSSGARGAVGVAPWLAYMAVITGVNLWTDSQLTLQLGVRFRFVHYVCFYYTTVLTGQFAVAMKFLGESFGWVNSGLGRVGGPSGVGVRRGLKRWMEGFLELREVEGLANEVFGKQILLMLLLAFSSAIVNVYYMISLNLYQRTFLWVNVMMFVGLFQSVLVAVVSTRAAESAACEANRVTEVILEGLTRWRDPKSYDQVKYFILFNSCHPMELRVWVFYAITNDSLFKVILTSSAVTTVILQCDFLGRTTS